MSDIEHLTEYCSVISLLNGISKETIKTVREKMIFFEHLSCNTEILRTITSHDEKSQDWLFFSSFFFAKAHWLVKDEYLFTISIKTCQSIRLLTNYNQNWSEHSNIKKRSANYKFHYNNGNFKQIISERWQFDVCIDCHRFSWYLAIIGKRSITFSLDHSFVISSENLVQNNMAYVIRKSFEGYSTIWEARGELTKIE